MKIKELKSLIKTRNTIKTFEGVKCGMTHERVVFERSSGLPVPNSTEPNSFKRINLCPIETRRKRLACGHTAVRNYLKDFIVSLYNYKEFNEVQIQKLYDALSKIDFDICSLDHLKGYAELKYASRLDEVFKIKEGQKQIESIISDDLNTEKEEIKKLEEQHDGYVGKMLELKTEILQIVDEVINKESSRLKHKILLKIT